MAHVQVYTTPTCPYCVRAKQLLGSLGVEYDEINVAAEPEKRQMLVEKHNWQTVPAIFAGEELLGGFDDINCMNAEGTLMEKLQG